MVRWIRRIAVLSLAVTLVAAGAAATAYFSGVTVPLHRDLTPVTLSNWNKTAEFEAEVDHDSRLVRRDGRVHFIVDLEIPEATGRLQAFLDGGRTEVVACGPQKLFLHSLADSALSIDGDRVAIRGWVDMELAGPIKLRDDWPASGALRFGHDQTTIWADFVSLDITNVPEPMTRALLQGHRRIAYSREQVLDIVAGSMKPGNAAILEAHRDRLDLAFEEVRPALRGDVLVLEAVVSIDEAAAFGVFAKRLRLAAAESASGLAALLGPAPAHAQVKLHALRKDLDGAGMKVLAKAAAPAGKDPKRLLETIWRALPPCRASF